MSVNKQIILGRLGADPETRTTGSGMVVCNLRVATDSSVKRGDQWEKETDWHRVVVFGRTAENCAKYLHKGSEVYIEGRTKHSSYEKDGQTKYTTEVLADVVNFIGGKSNGTSYDAPSQSGPPGDDF